MNNVLKGIICFYLLYSPLQWRGVGGKPLKIRVFSKKKFPQFLLHAKLESYKHQIVKELNY